jgi:hypothetical protein
MWDEREVRLRLSCAQTGSGAQSVFGLRLCEEQEHRNVGPR